MTFRRAADIGAAALAALVFFGSPAWAAKPARIVSLNLCTDQLLLSLAPRENIAALSFLVADPISSAYTAEARGIKLLRGQAEEILPLKPDLVFAGLFTTPATIRILKRFGIPVVTVQAATNFATIERNINLVARAIGFPERGKKLIEKLRETLPPESGTHAKPRPIAALLWANGFSSGRGTLSHAVIERAGFRNLASLLGQPGTHVLPMERLVEQGPDILVIGHPSPYPSLANKLLLHPALRAAFKAKPRIAIGDGLWLCGTPATARAVRLLSDKWKEASK